MKPPRTAVLRPAIARSAAFLAASFLAACSSPAPLASSSAAAAPGERLGAAPDAALVPMAFMAGAWAQRQPNGAIIEEHWMAPRGKSMLGSFRRILGNGAVPFYEFTQLVAEKDRVVLRQIHVHGNFDQDPKRTEPMELVLEASAPGKATFVPAADSGKANAGELARVTYAADGADTLVLTVEPRAREGRPADPPLVFRMSRVR